MRKGLGCLAVALLLVTIAQPGPARAAKSNKWKVPGDFATIEDALADPDVVAGDEIRVRKGNHAGAYVNKAVKIKGEGGAVIDTGPMHPAGLSMGFRLLEGSDGAEISHLTFTTDLSIMNGAAVNDVVVSHNTFYDSIQAISNWGGSRWTIDHNELEDLRTFGGGGIGVLVADSSGGIVEDNLVTHNKVSGTLHVYENDGGGYSGSGIVLYADFRWSRAGADDITLNLVSRNKVELVSDTPDVVDVVGFELSVVGPSSETACDIIFANTIEKNDLRRTTKSIALSPESLADCNDFHKNKARRMRMRGRRSVGLAARVFGPDM